MKQIYKIILLSFSFIIFYNAAFAQPWPNATWTTSGACTGNEPDIKKVYIDACFNPEQQNEFIYMKTGGSWDYSNFSMNGGSGQNAAATNLTTASNFIPASASVINILNGGLGATCLAPNNTVFIAGANPIPANATVMVYPSSGPQPGNIAAGSINYMCGKGPIYVITGNYVPGGIHGAFFRNGATMGGFVKKTNFNFGPCVKTLNYNNSAPASFPNDQGGNAVGAFVLGESQGGAVGTSACFEVAPCVGPPAPTFSPTTISICDETILNTSFACTNCAPGEAYSVYSNANDANSIIYTGTAFPPPGFLFGPPLYPAAPPGTGTFTYYIEKSGICASTKTPVTLIINAQPLNTPFFSAYTLTCANPTITVNPGGTAQGANFTYAWSGPNGFTSSSLTPTITQAGTYSMTVTNTATGCTKGVLFPAVTDNTAFPQVTPAPDKAITCNTPAPLSIGIASSTAGATYSWSNSATTATQNVSGAGTYIVSITNPSSGCVKKDTVVVTLDNTAPTVPAIPMVTVNCTTPNPTLTTAATGGTGLTYAWTPGGSTSANLSISTGGTYVVSVTNPSNGCKTGQSITVLEDKTLPDAVIAAAPILNCTNNSSATLNTAGTSTGANYTYNWSGPNGFASTLITPPNVTVDGTYNLTVTNTTNGCTKTASVTVTKDVTLPTADAGADKILNCINNQSVLIGGASSSGPNFTYNWSNPTNINATQTVTTPGTYTITVINTTNGCTKIDDVTVTQDIIAPVMSAIPQVTVNCTTPNPTLVTTTVGSNLVYAWTPSGSGANLSINAGGVYSVTVTNSVNGCTDSESITVTEDKVIPTAVIAAPAILTCINSSSTALNTTGTSTGANFTYNWSGPNGFASTLITPPNVTVDGTYSLTVTNTTNGCTKVVSTVVTKDVTLPTADAGADKLLTCTNGQSVLIGTAAVTGNTYLWSNTITTATQTVTTAGTYILTVTNTTNGCTKTDDVIVTADIVAPVMSPIAPVTVNCTTPNPTITTSTVGSNLVYTWTPSGSGANPTISVGGVYSVTVTNSVNGCTDTESVTVTEDKVIPVAGISLSANLSCLNNSMITLGTPGISTGPNFTYYWTGTSPGYPSTNLTPPTVTTPGQYSLTVTNTTNGCTKTASLPVAQNIAPPVPANMSPQVLTCTNNGQVTIGGTATGGTTFTYLWSNTQTSATQTVTTPGVYTVTVTNTTNGCTEKASVTITEDKTPPTVNAGLDLTINCTNPTANANATASGGTPLTYAWSGGSAGTNTLTPTFNAGGNYILTVTNTTNGCKASDDITVTSDKTDPTAVAVVSGGITCANISATLNITGSSTGANFTYGWTGPNSFTSSAQNPSVTVGGTYTLLVTNTTNGCTKTATISIPEDKVLPNAGVSNTPILTCSNPSIQLAGTGSAGGNFTYSWTASGGGTITAGANTLTPTVTTAGVYALTVTNTTNGCTKEAQVTVTEDKVAPVATATGSGTITCTTTTLPLGVNVVSGSNLQYQWTATNGGSIGGNANTQNVNALQGGTYNVLVTNAGNGCTVTSSVTITANNTPPTANAIASGSIDCNNTSITIDGSSSSSGAGFAFVWTYPNGSTNTTTLQPSVTLGGAYSLSITNTGNGCTATKTIVISENKTLPTVSVNAPGSITCTNPNVILTATGNANLYSWVASAGGNITSGGGTASATVNSVGTYTVTGINSTNGCQNTAVVNVTENKNLPTVVIAAASPITCSAPNVTLNATGSSVGGNFVYSWTASPGNFIGSQNSQQALVNQAGTYTLKITDTSNGCEKSSAVTVTDTKVLPTAVIANPTSITCLAATQVLDGSGSSSGANITYTWQLAGGANISANPSSASPTISSGGTYTLIVTNTTNSCTASTSVSVIQNTTNPSANAGTAKTITCSSTSVALAGTGSNGSQYQIQWIGPGGNVASASGGNTYTPTVTQTGNYTLKVTDIGNGCEANSNTSVSLDLNVPVANAGTAKQLDCNVTSVQLDGSGSTPGLTYNWTLNGTPLGQNTLTPTISVAGTYNLEVVNTANGCKGNAQVQVAENKVKPTLKIAKPNLLNCANPTLTLNGTGSSTGANFSYTWTTTGGNLISPATNITVTLDKAAVYNFKIKNAQNGCEKDSSVTILENFNKPSPAAAVPSLLTCTVPSTTIDASASTKIQNAKIVWKPQSSIISGGNTLKPTVNDAGFYKLILTDTLSKCSDSITVEVKKDANIPTANAGANAALNCTVKDVTLNGSGSTGANISYSWTTTNGGTITNPTTLTPNVSAAGKYTLKVTNSSNQCVQESSVTVTQDTTKPTIVIAKPGVLDCKTTVLSLDAIGSSSGVGFVTAWAIPVNAFVGGGALTPIVKLPGTFSLTITNNVNTCKSIKNVTVTQDIVKPTANISKADTLNCVNLTTKLSGSASSNSGIYTFNWIDTPNGITKDKTTLTPAVNQAGAYQLMVTDTVNHCSSTAQITVIKDVVTPTVSAGAGGNLTCTVKDLTLKGSASNGNAANFAYTWTTVTGNIVGAINTPDAKGDLPGVYCLEVLNKVNGCKSNSCATISQDANVPKVEILTKGDLDCKTKTLVLDGNGSSQGAGITFKWSAKNGGCFDKDQTTLNPTISCAGVYILEIKNSNNNCIKEIEKTINSDVKPPTINVKQDILTCNKPNVELNAKVFDATKYTFTWTTASGNIVSKKDSLDISIDKKGDYILTVKNTDNECEATKTINVLEDKVKPTVDCGQAFEINCKDSIVTLQGDKSSTGTEFAYIWTTVGGNILQGDKTLTPDVDKAGTYTLSIINKNNGCQNNNSVVIKINKILPIINLVKPDTLTCKTLKVNLLANATVTGVAQYNWSGTGILTDKTKQSVEADKTGSYLVIVTDDKNKCVSKVNTTVYQDTEKPTVNAGADIELNCKNPTIDIQGTATAKQALTYLWTTTTGTIVANADKAKVTVKTAGTYNLLVTNKFNGCAASDDMEVTFLGAPKAVISTPQTLTCERKSILLDSKGSDTGANYSYTWTNAAGTNLGTDATLNTSLPGTYYLNVNNSSNQCDKKEVVIVTQDIVSPTANAGASDVIDCAKGYVILNANNSSQGAKYTYKWSGGLIESGANTINPKVTAQSTYTILVTNTENGCTASDTVNVKSLKPALLKVVPKNPACFGDKGSIVFQEITGGTPPFSYSINGGKTFASADTYKGLKAGDYNVVVKDSKGCEDSSSVSLIDPEKLTLSLELKDATKVKIGEDAELQLTVNPSIPLVKSIVWSPDSLLSCKDCLTPTIKMPLRSLYLTVKVTNENGCAAFTSTTVEVDRTIGVYVPNQFSPNNDNTNDRFIAFGDPNLILRIKWFRVVDRWGDNVFEEFDIKAGDITKGWDGNFKGNPMNPGVFVWNCEVEFIDGRTKILKGDVTLNR